VTATHVAQAVAFVLAFAWVMFAATRAERSSTVLWKPGKGPHRGPLVYLVRAMGTRELKVGMTTATVDERVGGWETGRPEECVLEGAIYCASKAHAYRTEASIHRALKRKRRHLGKEWFRCEPEQADDWRPVIEKSARA
jgi:hypothetical protein